MRLKKALTAVMILSLMLSSGCWDMIEIERRAIIGVFAIDVIENYEEKSEQGKEAPFCEDKPKRIVVTFGVNNPSKVQEGGENAFVTRTVEAANLPDAMEELGMRTSRIPFYGQTRLIILTDKLLKEKKLFMEVMDELERKPILNQTARVVVIKNKVEDLFKVKSTLEPLLSLYIVGLMQNSKVLSTTVNMNLNDLITQLRGNDGDAAIPIVEVEEMNQGKGQTTYKIDTLALIKDFKFLTTLDSKYIKTYKLMRDDFKSGRKLINYKGIIVPFYIFSADRKIRLEDDSEGLSFRVNVMLEGDIEQFEFGERLLDPGVISDVEKTVNEFTEKELSAATEHMQKEIGYDYLGFREYLNKYHYKVFLKYEKNWDEAFRNAKIDYVVDTSIRRIGKSKE